MTGSRSKDGSVDQIIPRRRVPRSLVPVLSAVGLCSLMAVGVSVLHMRAAAVPSPDPVPAVTVNARPIVRAAAYSVTTTYLGRIEAARRSALAFERGGLVRDVEVDEGAAVEAGTVVARLDTDILDARRKGLQAQRREAEAQRELAVLTAERQGSLNGLGFASTQRFDEARLSTTALDARLDMIAAEIAAIDIEIDKAALRAPFAGTVAQRHMDEGTVAAVGAAVVDILETGRMQARVGVSTEHAGTLQPGARVSLRASGRTIDAVVAAVRPDLETRTRTLEVLLDLVGNLHTFADGEVVEFDVAVTVREPGSWLPLSALHEDASGLWTLTVIEPDTDGLRAGRAAVEILHVAGAHAYVRGTFGPQARVLADGTGRIVPGQRVRLVE